MNLDMFELKIYAILPVLILVCGGVCLLLINVFSSVFSKGLNVALSALFLGVSAVFSLNLKVGESFFGLININGITALGQFSMEVCALIFIVLFGSNALIKHKHIMDKSFLIKEFYPLYLLMIAGFDIMVSSTHLVVILLGLEIGSLSLCVLIALNHKSKGIEAGIKYFVMSVLASVFYIFGAVCLYYACASLDIAHIHDILVDDKYTSVFAVFGGIVFILAAVSFKASAVPFHSWMPDIYEGANSIMAGVVSIIPKIAAFSVAIILLGAFLKVGIIWLESALYIIIVLTITLPNIAALIQNDVKRMLAFSSISHSGFVLACVLVGTQMSLSALYLYWFMFIITNVGTFGLIWLKELKNGANATNAQNTQDFSDKTLESNKASYTACSESKCVFAKISRKINALFSNNISTKTPYDIPFSAFNGLVRISPLKAFLGAIFMFSLAGIPPFGVFWGKLWAIMSVYGVGFVGLALVMMINSAIAGFYYLRLVVAMFLLPPNADNVANASNTMPHNDSAINHTNDMQDSMLSKIIIGIMGVLCVGSIFMAQFLLDFIGKYVIGAY